MFNCETRDREALLLPTGLWPACLETDKWCDGWLDGWMDARSPTKPCMSGCCHGRKNVSTHTHTHTHTHTSRKRATSTNRLDYWPDLPLPSTLYWLYYDLCAIDVRISGAELYEILHEHMYRIHSLSSSGPSALREGTQPSSPVSRLVISGRRTAWLLRLHAIIKVDAGEAQRASCQSVRLSVGVVDPL